MAKPAVKTALKPAPKPIVKSSTKPVPPKHTTTALTKTSSAGVPANVAAAADKYAGMGISDRMEDNIVPLIYLLQSNSKPATRGHERYIQGAVGGSIWLRNDPPELCLIDGDDGFIFQPCHLSVCWIEWMPDRGGFVARHQFRPEAATLQDRESDDGTIRKVWIMPSGNTVNESREYSGFVHREGMEPAPYTMPLSGSGHSIGKAWMTSMRNEKLPSGARAPLFFNTYLIKTKLKTKNDWAWYIFDISKNGPVTDVEDIERGAGLYEAFESGTKQSADIEDDAGLVDGSSSDTSDDHVDD